MVVHLSEGQRYLALWSALRSFHGQHAEPAWWLFHRYVSVLVNGYHPDEQVAPCVVVSATSVRVGSFKIFCVSPGKQTSSQQQRWAETKSCFQQPSVCTGRQKNPLTSCWICFWFIKVLLDPHVRLYAVFNCFEYDRVAYYNAVEVTCPTQTT